MLTPFPYQGNSNVPIREILFANHFFRIKCSCKTSRAVSYRKKTPNICILRILFVTLHLISTHTSTYYDKETCLHCNDVVLDSHSQCTVTTLYGLSFRLQGSYRFLAAFTRFPSQWQCRQWEILPPVRASDILS